MATVIYAVRDTEQLLRDCGSDLRQYQKAPRKVKNPITPTEAREIAWKVRADKLKENTRIAENVLADIYGTISASAKDGKYWTKIKVGSLSDDVITLIEKRLRSDGYSVTAQNMGDKIISLQLGW